MALKKIGVMGLKERTRERGREQEVKQKAASLISFEICVCF